MFSALPEAERDAITVIVFIGTFFGALTVGRFLKRRAGVRLGLLFRLFCLVLAFYAAIAVYGVHASWRNHVGAAAILLSTALVVALVRSEEHTSELQSQSNIVCRLLLENKKRRVVCKFTVSALSWSLLGRGCTHTPTNPAPLAYCYPLFSKMNVWLDQALPSRPPAVNST